MGNASTVASDLGNRYELYPGHCGFRLAKSYTITVARQFHLRYTQLRDAPAEWRRLKLDLHSERSLRQVSVRYVQ